jgi:hypothetical protein
MWLPDRKNATPAPAAAFPALLRHFSNPQTQNQQSNTDSVSKVNSLYSSSLRIFGVYSIIPAHKSHNSFLGCLVFSDELRTCFVRAKTRTSLVTLASRYQYLHVIKAFSVYFSNLRRGLLFLSKFGSFWSTQLRRRVSESHDSGVDGAIIVD